MKKAILLAAYGASSVQSREGLRDFESLCRARFPGWPVRWAFTSLASRERMARRRQKSDSIAKALLRLHFEKFQVVAIQPLQAIPGGEYAGVRAAVEDAAQRTGMACALGAPLLNSASDIAAAARAILAGLPPERQATDDVVLMGHGARHPAVSLYGELDQAMRALDGAVYLGTMSGSCRLEHILPNLRSETVWLLPLLSLIGGHALFDMAGDSPSSWKTRIERQGHICRPILRGLVQCPHVSEIWLSHLRQAAQSLPRFTHE